MRLSVGATGLAFLATLASCQMAQYCDELDRCFNSFTNPAKIRYGFAIPEVTAAPFDTILQITAPISVKWVGVAWSGAMTNSPLTVTWPNGEDTVVSPRVAFSYTAPTVYDGETLNLLDGSYTNDTHWVSTIHCQGCSSWADLGTGSINPTAENYIGFVYSKTAVTDPSNPDSGFSVHDNAISTGFDFSLAQSPDFEKWIGDGSPEPTASPTTTSVPAPTSTVPIPTGELPIPSDCGETSLFPLEVAEGWSFVKLAGSLSNPRQVTVDPLGSLLVVEVGYGLSVHTFGTDGCLTSSKKLIDRPQLTHSVTLAEDGTKLLVSSIDTVWRYSYDAATQTVSDEEVVVKDMFRSSHSTRTLVIPPATPNLLVVSLGSHTNLDMASFDPNTGRAIVKVFDLAQLPSGGYSYSTEGWWLGYGLRNEVALAVDNNNMVWGVENSADDFARVIDGVSTDIHEENPADELNYLGDPSAQNDNWYGYPTCFSVWGGDLFPDGNPTTGSSFIPEPNSTWSDATCQEKVTGPRLSIKAHSAPIDAKFDPDNANLYVTLHGSWNRDVPTGYKVVTVPFTKNAEGGFEPVAAADSQEGYNDILWDPQEGCDNAKCFRPSGLSWDLDHTRLFIASDNSQEGELYILSKNA
jgi:glucose/arabinose dehydrogenase